MLEIARDGKVSGCQRLGGAGYGVGMATRNSLKALKK